MDQNNDGVIEALELGYQVWNNQGRIIFVSCNQCGLSGEIPSQIEDLEYVMNTLYPILSTVIKIRDASFDNNL